MPSFPRAAPSDGYPTPSPSQLAGISQRADGTLPNAGAPPALSEGSVPLFQAIALVEEFEVALFSSILQNITNNVPGFTEFNLLDRDAVVNILDTVVDQEELHTINARNLLGAFQKLAPLPCQYKFPSTTFTQALDVAAIWTDVGLGALQDVLELVGTNGDDVLLRDLAAVVGQEGEQEGFYRMLLGRKPAERPFPTFALGPYAFSYVVNTFIVPGSCPFDISDINLPLFGSLTIQNGFDVAPKDQTLTFTAELTDVAEADPYIGGNGSGLFVTYFTGQLKPISEPLSNVRWSGREVTFQANFPFTANLMWGLTVASLTTTGSFNDASNVLNATLAAPGLININDLY
ncbi:hypothetical protein GQ53DRAFT_671994 [Thozetella sp. PMI_491]|nr:hypothetical protein GQ53DRAFT_671994 [Thozetella sp. PMI_491]